MSSKFLDKTGLDTLWAKIKSTFQTLGNLVTAWGSTPSDAKYPSEKLVKDSLDAISTNARTIPQDISKGANLVVNSNGTLQTNYNWTATTFIGDTDLPEGVAGCFHRVGADYFFCNEFISLNTSKEFTVESWYRVKTANTSTVRLTLACFDIDKKSIQATDICYGIGTLTTVAREIKNGDTEIYLTDLSASAWDTSTYYERRLIFWDYQNSLGYTYPPETYSKHTYYKSNSSNGTWLRGSLDRENNKITLIVPWDGGTVPVGTKVSRGGSGITYYYAATSPASGAATVWTKLSGKLKGFSNNVAGGGPFRPGTAFVKIGWVNANTASPEWFEFCGIELRENPSAFNGVLPVANGGTGATTAIGAEYNILNQVADIDTTINGDRKIALCNQTKSASNGVFRWLKLSNVWTWIKSKLTDSDVNIGGNAATATTATTAAGYTSDGAIDTALQGKATPADITSAIQALDVASQGGDGKYIKAISEADGKISATAETMDTAPTANSTKAVTSGGVKAALDGKQDDLGISSSGDAGKFLNEQGEWQVPDGTSAKVKSYYSKPSLKGVKFATTTVTAADATSYGVFQFARLQIGTGIKTLSGNADKPIVGIVQIFHRTNGSGETVADKVMARITVFQSDFTGEFRVYYQINGSSVDWYIATTTAESFVVWRTLKLFSYGTVNDIELSGVNDVSALTENNASYKTPLVEASSTGTGNSSTPVYVNSDGRLEPCKEMLNKSGDNATSGCANALLSALPKWTATPGDEVELIRRDTGGAASFGRVAFLTVWNYIKTKIHNGSLGSENRPVCWTGSNLALSKPSPNANLMGTVGKDTAAKARADTDELENTTINCNNGSVRYLNAIKFIPNVSYTFLIPSVNAQKSALVTSTAMTVYQIGASSFTLGINATFYLDHAGGTSSRHEIVFAYRVGTNLYVFHQY